MEVYAASKRMRDWFAERAPFVAFAGEGIGRMAFVTEDGKCLKLARGISGIWQNKEEISILSGKPDFAVRMFACDKSDKPLALETEACEKATAACARKALKDLGFTDVVAPRKEFKALLDAIFTLGWAGMDTKKATRRMLETGYGCVLPREELDAAFANIIRGGTAQAKLFWKLAKFYEGDMKAKAAGKRFISLTDLSLDNFGVVVRGGERLMVVLDAGM